MWEGGGAWVVRNVIYARLVSDRISLQGEAVKKIIHISEVVMFLGHNWVEIKMPSIPGEVLSLSFFNSEVLDSNLCPRISCRY